jgi:hypothetical protein
LKNQVNVEEEKEKSEKSFAAKVVNEASKLTHKIGENLEAGYEKVKETIKETTGIGKDDKK